ncbi:MAG: succinate-semialdehyde dehydrogenase/glutarate-semialdehyde dehydrogenase [Alphaproteobacteria bacterium]|jgi:succinate-semialdehyde dehydrogenase/glutarate-semialdehyde dehydrogenase
MKSINPATGEMIKEYVVMSDKEASTIVDMAHLDFLDWRKSNFDTRSKLMHEAANVLHNNKEKYAKLMTKEMGKVYNEAIAEVEKCIWVCKYYAEHAQGFLADEPVKTDASNSFVTYQPIGAVLAVMPWNFPLWQVFRFAVPALMAGNVGLLKHASNVCGCALAIEEVFREAGFPKNAFRTLLIKSDQVVHIIEHKYVRAVTLTGSTKAGSAVASKAGECLKKSVLELGGSDAYLILKDAELEYAAETCVKSRLINAGQSCIAAKRFIVAEEVYDEFLELFTQKMKAIKVGNPMDEDTDIGPQASEGLRYELHKQVQTSIKKGATCVLGGELPEGEGFFYPPTILTNVTEGMPAYDEELFGPVASVIKAKSEEEAIAVANSTPFGLGGSVFTRDIEHGTDIARNRIDSGACVVNDLVKSDPRLPFGGVKESGYGRELSHFGIREFVNIKAVSVK